MKKHLFTLIFALGISVVLNAGQTYAQDPEAIRADIPFAFGVNNRTQPAGTYRINSINDSRSIWKLQGTSSGTGALFVPGIRAGSANYGNLRLTFHRYGDKYFLVAFKTNSYEIALPRSKDEKTLRASLDKLQKMDVIAIETVAARSF